MSDGCSRLSITVDSGMAFAVTRLPHAPRWPILVPTMRPRDRRLLVVLAFAALLVLAVLVHHAGTEALLAAPLLALLAPLLAGRYLGEEHIGRLAAARAAAGHTVARAPRTSAPLRAPGILAPRGGRLLATSLAVRPPPALAQIS